MGMSHFRSVGYETTTNMLRRAPRSSRADVRAFILDLTVRTKRSGNHARAKRPADPQSSVGHKSIRCSFLSPGRANGLSSCVPAMREAAGSRERLKFKSPATITFASPALRSASPSTDRDFDFQPRRIRLNDADPRATEGKLKAPTRAKCASIDWIMTDKRLCTSAPRFTLPAQFGDLHEGG